MKPPLDWASPVLPQRNCHNWLCAPKGAGFLWARAEHHGWIDDDDVDRLLAALEECL